MSDLPLHRTMQDDEIDRLKAQLKEAEGKGRVLMDMCRDLRARVTELESTGSTSTACPFCFDQMRNNYILRKQAEAVGDIRKDLLSDLPDHPVSRQVAARLELRVNSLREKAEKAGGGQ